MRILLTHTPVMRANYYGEQALAGLRALGEVRLVQSSTALTPEELIGLAADVDVIIADRMTTGPASIFSNLPDLKAFLRCAVDIRNIDVTAASAAGVLVTRAKPGFAEAVTELTLGFLVDLARGISRATAAYQGGGRPEVRMGRQLAGSTLGLIGYGNIGRHVANVAAVLGMSVLVADPYVTVDDPRFRQVSLHELLAASDHVVCLAVATDATENLMDARAFRLMKRDAVFVNVSRGNLVDESALHDALRDGIIAGAAMDVGRAADQMPTPALAALPGVIATPHIGGLTPPAIAAQALDTVEQVRELAGGEIPHGAVNAASWRRRF
jgi:D-3-phosphoglycerate dehydrogenase / 2-oxoglutarate reductase